MQRLYEVRRNVAEIVRGWEKVQRLYERLVSRTVVEARVGNLLFGFLCESLVF